jgi:hypothetical protein
VTEGEEVRSGKKAARQLGRHRRTLAVSNLAGKQKQNNKKGDGEGRSGLDEKDWRDGIG